MPKDSILQIRIDGDLKKQAEDLYSQMGISLSEAVRMFIAQSVQEGQMPFHPHTTVQRGSCKAYGALRLYSKPHVQDTGRYSAPTRMQGRSNPWGSVN